MNQQIVLFDQVSKMGGYSSCECDTLWRENNDNIEQLMIVNRRLSNQQMLSSKQRPSLGLSGISNDTTNHSRQVFLIEQSISGDKSDSSSFKQLGYIQDANHCYQKGNLQQAINNYMIALHKVDRKDIMMAEINFAIGQCYFSLGNFKMALRHCKLAQAKYAQLTGKNSEGVAMTCNLIGHIQAEASDYLLAQHYYEKAYKIYREQIGQNYQNLLQVGFNLAALYLNIDEDNKALQIYEQIEFLIEGNNSYTNHTIIIQLYRCLGVNCFKLYLYQRSLQHFNKALDFSLQLTLLKNHQAEKLFVSFKLVKDYLQSVPSFRKSSLFTNTIKLYQRLKKTLE